MAPKRPNPWLLTIFFQLFSQTLIYLWLWKGWIDVIKVIIQLNFKAGYPRRAWPNQMNP